MRIKYYPKEDAVYIELGRGHDVHIDYRDDGTVLGMEVLDVNGLDISTIEEVCYPVIEYKRRGKT